MKGRRWHNEPWRSILQPLLFRGVLFLCFYLKVSHRAKKAIRKCVTCWEWAHSLCTGCENDIFICDYFLTFLETFVRFYTERFLLFLVFLLLFIIIVKTQVNLWEKLTIYYEFFTFFVPLQSTTPLPLQFLRPCFWQTFVKIPRIPLNSSIFRQ